MRILIADDDPLSRLLAREVIASLGHEPREAGDGESAWRIFEEASPALVVLDLEMPALGGVELLRRIRASDSARAVFVLVCTGRDGGDVLRTVLDAGADDFVTKPVAPEQLRARIVIAARRLAQDAARREAEAALQRARWLAGIGETSIAMQHEINNPLSAIMSRVELLRMERDLPTDVRESLREVLDSARRIADVVRRLQALREPKTIEYVRGTRMLDLRRDGDTPPYGGGH